MSPRVLLVVAAGVLAFLALGNGEAPAAPAEEWGPESAGLRCRLVAVPAEANDESPDVTKSTDKYPRGDAVTLAVELKNVTDKPITLLGVRYGDSYPTAAGKLNTSFFAPHLFDIEFTDAAGKPVSRPKRTYLGSMLELSGASAHEVAPGKSIVILLRPSAFNPPMEYWLPPGSYKAVVRYHGPSEKARAEMSKHWPDKPQGKAWIGEATSNAVAFTVNEDPKAPKAAELPWGEEKNGLRAAVELRSDRRDASADSLTVPLNSKLDVVFHLKNVSQKPISLVSETWRQEDQATVKDASGLERQLSGSWYSGWPIMVRWTLQPGEVAELHAANIALAADEEAIKKFEHPVGKTLIAEPGKYLFRYTIRIGSIQQRDAKGNVLVPGKEDWQGEIVTGETPVVIRARTAADDARDRAGNFTGKIEFVGKDGKPITAGTFTYRTAGAQSEVKPVSIHAGAIDVPDCSSRALTIRVRAPGFEEALFYDVPLKAGETKCLELTPALPARFRVVTMAGKPIAGATVRFFNKTCDKASAGPYPTDGLKGPIWATSQPDGTVVLDTLQKVDPYYEKLGDAVYFFYVEAAGMAGQFVGGIKAGQDLGDVKLSPPLEVRGEIRGSAAELERFAAEWDQPFELRTANPTAKFAYAVSEKLTTKRNGDKLTFHLTGLRPGKLRIVCNFGPQPHKVSHTYGKRDAKGSDIEIEFEVKENMTDVIITPAGRQMAAR